MLTHEARKQRDMYPQIDFMTKWKVTMGTKRIRHTCSVALLNCEARLMCNVTAPEVQAVWGELVPKGETHYLQVSMRISDAEKFCLQ
jgi:hypothetical protein